MYLQHKQKVTHVPRNVCGQFYELPHIFDIIMSLPNGVKESLKNKLVKSRVI